MTRRFALWTAAERMWGIECQHAAGPAAAGDDGTAKARARVLSPRCGAGNTALFAAAPRATAGRSPAGSKRSRSDCQRPERRGQRFRGSRRGDREAGRWV